MNNKQRLLSKSIFIIFSLVTFILIGCNNPIGTNSNPSTPQEGKGSFILTLSDVSRTILPDTPNLSDFAVYSLNFSPTSDGTAESVDRTNETLSSIPVILDPGTYMLTVYAYKDSEKTQLMAQGTVSDIIINAGSSVSAAVTLKTFLESGTGTFRWNISIPTDVTTADMIIVPGNSDGTTAQTVSLLPSATSGNCTLNSGFYNLTINLTKADGKAVMWSELLYVYGNLDSVFIYTFTDVHFSNSQYTVTFKYNDSDNSGTTTEGIQSVLHGGQVTRPINPVRSGYTFSGWFTDNGLTMSFNIDTQLIESITLYAQWESTVTFNDRGNIETRVVRTPSTNVSSLPTPTRTGYTFNGWNTLSNGNGLDFTSNTTVTGNITLYAIWIPISYTVIYNSNRPSNASSSIAGSTASSIHTYDQSSNLRSNGFSLTGWIFEGWSTTVNGARASYGNGVQIINLPNCTTGTVTLYAQWRPNTYYVQIDHHYSYVNLTSNSVREIISIEYDESRQIRPKSISIGMYFSRWLLPNGLINTSSTITIFNATTTDGALIIYQAYYNEGPLPPLPR